MILGMFLIGRIFLTKIFLKPHSCGLGIQPSPAIKANLNIFASLLYHTFVGFVKRTVKLKKTDFRSDSDLFSETHLYDRYIIDKYIMQMDMQRTSEVE